jgi:hypothetical protein
VVGRVLGLDCGEATIKANATGTDDESHGYAVIANPVHYWQRGDGPKRQLADAYCMALYAGAEAEKAFFGHDEPIIGDGPDQDRATGCLKLVGVPGASYVQDDVWDRYEARLRQKSRIHVMRYRHVIERVAQALLQREELTAEDIAAIVEGN